MVPKAVVEIAMTTDEKLNAQREGRVVAFLWFCFFHVLFALIVTESSQGAQKIFQSILCTKENQFYNGWHPTEVCKTFTCISWLVLLNKFLLPSSHFQPRQSSESIARLQTGLCVSKWTNTCRQGRKQIPMRTQTQGQMIYWSHQTTQEAHR